MDITVVRFLEIYPEFDSVENSDIQYAIELAMEVHRCSANAVYALVAHLIALSAMEGTGGDEPSGSVVQTVKKSRVGRISTEYFSMFSDKHPENSYYETTPYGRRFLMLQQSALKKLATRVV
jgi:hypothetical protein